MDGQLPEDRKLAKRVICWIVYAQRFLKAEESCHALTIEPGDKELDEDNVPELKNVLSSGGQRDSHYTSRPLHNPGILRS
jgi:hypothetical protein